MSENVKTRPRAGRRATAPLVEVPPTETAPTDATVTDAADAAAPEVAVAEVPAAEGAATDPADIDTAHTPAAGSDAAPDVVSGAAGGVVGWADAVPWLALRWGSTPTPAEVRCAPIVWQMLADQSVPAPTGRTGRTALQMAAAAELAGHTELDPTVLAKVLGRYEKAGVVRAVTEGRLTWWSVLDPAQIIAEARESALVFGRASAARTARTGVVSRVGDRAATPPGELRGLVADHLAGNPFEDFSPSQIAKALNRSSGAVANALDRLVELGAAIQTSASPRRYQHHPDTDVTVAVTAQAPADDTDGAEQVQGAQE